MRRARRHRHRPPSSLRWRARVLTHRLRGTTDDFAVPHAHVWVDTEDGVRLSGSLIGDRHDTAVVLVHGFMGFRGKPKGRSLAEALASRFTVFAFDLRGHGQSEGHCTGGDLEALDVGAVLAAVRRRGFDRVAVVGWSLGGIAAIRGAAEYGGADAVVAISAPAEWVMESTKAVRRATWLFVSPVGRAIAHRVFGTRILFPRQMKAAPPAEVVHKIAPSPVLIVHGEDDHFFPPRHAKLLYERAEEPKRLLLEPVFGHAEDGFTPAFAERLGDEIAAMLSPRPV